MGDCDCHKKTLGDKVLAWATLIALCIGIYTFWRSPVAKLQLQLDTHIAQDAHTVSQEWHRQQIEWRKQDLAHQNETDEKFVEFQRLQDHRYETILLRLSDLKDEIRNGHNKGG